MNAAASLDWLGEGDEQAPEQDPAHDAFAAFLDAAEAVERPVHPGWSPQPGPQTAFYTSTCAEVLYGGEAGGGKSSAVVAIPLQWVAHSRYRALVLRRETPQLEGLLDEARAIYKFGNDTSARPFGGADHRAEFRGDKCVWTFKSGAKVRFNHCQTDDDAANYQGHEYQTIVFDELTHFTEFQYLEVKSRNRSGAVGIPCYTRATSNPGGPGHEWVFRRWGPWLDPDRSLSDWEREVVEADGSTSVVRGRGLPARIAGGKQLPPAAGGVELYVAKIGDVEHFSTEPFTVAGEAALTRTFIPAKLADNPALLASDPSYRAKLRDLDPVRRAQLEDGNWLAKKGEGRFFKREYFEFVDAVPAGVRRVRAWDLAATEPSADNKDPDWTCGVKLARDAAGWIVEDVIRFRVGPGAVEARIKATAELDGRSVIQRLPQDPGQAGKAQAPSFVRLLAGFIVHTKVVGKASGSKETRAGIVAAQAHPQSTGGTHGRIRIKRAPWNEAFILELEKFPTTGVHDDQVDALSDAFDELSASAPVRGVATTPIGFF